MKSALKRFQRAETDLRYWTCGELQRCLSNHKQDNWRGLKGFGNSRTISPKKEKLLWVRYHSGEGLYVDGMIILEHLYILDLLVDVTVTKAATVIRGMADVSVFS